MGRYTTRFEAGGSNAVGATYTAAAGGGNSKFAVAANGQTLSRADYPALANYYSGQTSLDTLNLNQTITGSLATGTVYTPYNVSRSDVYGGGQVSVEFSGFQLYIQKVNETVDSGTITYNRIWYTQDGGDSWKLTDFKGSFSDGGFVKTSGAVYIVTDSGLYKTTDGLNYNLAYTGNVRSITEQSGVAIFISGANLISTTATGDFVTITSVVVPSFNGYGLVEYSGVLYAFQNSATGIRYSTDVGQTWNNPPSGLPGTSYSRNPQVIDGYLVATANAANVPVFVYSTDPTGTVNTWTSASVNTRTDAAPNCVHIVHDSGTNTTLFAIKHLLLGSSTQDIFGYLASGGVTGTVIPCTGTLQTNAFSSGTYSNGTCYPFFIASGDKRAVYNDWLFKVEKTSGTWSGITSVSMNLSATDPGYGMTPFFPVANFEYSGWAALGTTNSGNSYIIKGNATNNVEYMQVCSIYVEQSGYYKQLQSVQSGITYSRAGALTTNTGVFQSVGFGYNNMKLAEASGNYIAAWTWSGSSYSGVYYKSFSQATNSSTGDFQRILNINDLSDSSWVCCSTKSEGLYFIYTSTVTASTYSTGVYVPPSGTASRFSWRVSGVLPTVYSAPGIFYSDIDNEVLLSYYSTGTVTGAVASLNGGQINVSTYTLLNATGGVVSPVSGSYMIKSQNQYYVIDVSGNVYKGSNRFNLTKYTQGASIPTSSTGSSYNIYREIAETKIIGPMYINNKYGEFSVTNIRPTGFNYNRTRSPELIKNTDNSYLIHVPGGFNLFTGVSQGTGFFTVPSIPNPGTGESKYIIAR